MTLDGFDAEVEKLRVYTYYLARTAIWLEREVDKLRESCAVPMEK